MCRTIAGEHTAGDLARRDSHIFLDLNLFGSTLYIGESHFMTLMRKDRR